MAHIPPPPPTDEGLPRPLEMTERERALRDCFVAEYLIDYSSIKAAMRCGFPREFAIEWSQKLMEEAYVQKRIASVALTPPADDDEELEFDKRRVRQRLLQEAFYMGPGSSHAARVAALAKLAQLFEMEPSKKITAELNHQGGVMRTPAPVGADDWEKAAQASQAALAGHGS